ncbi:MAG: flagellar type III secretion system pore protein FliP [Bacillota bacterium]
MIKSDKNKYKLCFIFFTMVIVVALLGLLPCLLRVGQAAPLPGFELRLQPTDQPEAVVGTVRLLVLLTALALVPAFLVMTTSFTRIIVVLSFVRNALATQQTPPNQLLIGLALFLTFFTMGPLFSQINQQAVTPYLAGTMSQEEALSIGEKPLREFMFKQTREKDLALFISMAQIPYPRQRDDVPFRVLVPAFVISELKTAFQMGFLIYIPFLIIDIVVASTLMAMGMFMVPPIMISLPFKILLFILVDGWYLIVKSLIQSF